MLPDELRATTLKKYRKLCDSCCCHNERELAVHLAEERHPRACPRPLRLGIGVRLPAYLSLPVGVAGPDTSWHGLLMHLKYPLRDRLVMLLPAWEVGLVGIQTYTMGIRGSHDPDRWRANLTQLGLQATRMEALVRNLTLQALTGLTNLYSTRYAALHRLQHAQ